MLWLLLWLHQVTAPTQNNRTLKVTLMEGQIRIAYTILFGDLPAEAERRRMDASGDGQVSEPEARAFGEKLARRIEAALTMEIDGRRAAVRFGTVDVGLGGDRAVQPVPFSVDLVALVAVAGGGEHGVWLEDRSTLAALGETDLVVEEAPGTRVETSHSGREGPEGVHGLKWTWVGPRTSDLEDRSIALVYRCKGPPPGRARSGRRALWLGVGGVFAAVLLAMLCRRAISRAGTDTRRSSGSGP